MTLGSFTPRSRVNGDKMDLRNQSWYGRPYLVQVQDYSDSFHSKMKGGAVEAVWVDLMDVATGSVLINVLFTNGAFVDNLKEHTGTGTVLPVKFGRATGGNYGGYAILEALEGQELAAAQQAYNSWGNVIQERQRREQLAQQASNGFQGQPAQGGFGQPAQGQFPQEPQQGGMFGGAQGGFGQPQAPAQGGFGQPQAPAQGGFGQPQAPAQGGFGQPQAPAQNDASAMLNQLNNQLGG